MKAVQKSETIKSGLRKGPLAGSSKMSYRRCYGYEAGPDGELTINPDKASGSVLDI